MKIFNILFPLSVVFLLILAAYMVANMDAKEPKYIKVYHTHPNPTHSHTDYITEDSVWVRSGLKVKDWENIKIIEDSL